MRWSTFGALGALGVALAGCVPDPDVWAKPGVDLFEGFDTVDGFYRFTEGPAADAKGGLYFSDYVKQAIFYRSAKGEVKTVREGTSTNGLALGPDGTLYACEPLKRRVVRVDSEGALHEVAAEYAGKRFNSCNDLWVDSEGGIYFTDPLYSKDRAREQDGEHVYYVPKGGAPRRVIDDLVRPNGIVGSADGKLLYVVDDGRQQTYRYPVIGPGELGPGVKVFAAGADGLALDAEGRIYVVEETVLVFDPDGDKLAELDMPFLPTNLTFGGPKGNLLFVTGKWVVFVIETKTRGDGR